MSYPLARAHCNQASVIWVMLPAISSEIGFAPVIAVKAQNQSAFFPHSLGGNLLAGFVEHFIPA
jgi:hypothetical protein